MGRKPKNQDQQIKEITLKEFASLSNDDEQTLKRLNEILDYVRDHELVAIWKKSNSEEIHMFYSTSIYSILSLPFVPLEAVIKRVKDVKTNKKEIYIKSYDGYFR